MNVCVLTNISLPTLDDSKMTFFLGFLFVPEFCINGETNKRSNGAALEIAIVVRGDKAVAMVVEEVGCECCSQKPHLGSGV